MSDAGGNGRATWDEIRARGAAKLGSMDVFCGDCAMVFPHSGLPCRKHATPEESAAIDEQLLKVLQKHPFVEAVNRIVRGMPSFLLDAFFIWASGDWFDRWEWRMASKAFER